MTIVLDGKRTPEWWDQYFLRMAEFVAGASKDPSTKCGAVIVRQDKTVAATGFNGFPRGCSDSPEIYADRELKYARVVHAETNAILHCRDPFPLTGYTLYTFPGGLSPSCDRCTTNVIQAGLSRVVHYVDDSEFAQRWADACGRALDMYREAGIEIVQL